MKQSGINWTILRPHHFMQSLLTQTQYVITDGVVYSASCDGKIPYIDARARRCLTVKRSTGASKAKRLSTGYYRKRPAVSAY
jgi:uncharacterized protein YbjT (DUF2867 family)